MTDRPILFSTPMILALFAGRKTQTRRKMSSPLYRTEIGDRLYVRESFRYIGGNNLGMPLFHADSPESAAEPGWRRPFHMPRWASRLTLTVVDVRLQRLQDITEADAMAEGAEPLLVPPDGGSAAHVEGFRTLWDALHKDERFAWAANPEVVALSFTVERRNIDSKAMAYGERNGRP